MRQSLKGETEVEVRSGGEKRCEEMGEWRREEKMREEKRRAEEKRVALDWVFCLIYNPTTYCAL